MKTRAKQLAKKQDEAMDAVYYLLAEIVSVIAYQPEVPHAHKEDLCSKFDDLYRARHPAKARKGRK